MMKKLCFGLYLICLLALGCANPQGPSGGPDDRKSPTMLDNYSSSNEQTNYTGEPLVFTFDEFVAVKDASNQIVVSPPLKYPLDVQARGKKVIAKFHPSEELLPNTTYSMFFGDAIQDFTAGNPTDDMSYVFSTGNQVDTASAKVLVVSSDKEIDLSKMLVFVYEDMSDTAFTETKPRYIARVDSQGLAQVSYMKSGTYQFFVLEDVNKNYKFDPGIESVGFNEGASYEVSNDKALSITFNVFKPNPHPKILDAQKINQDSFLKFIVSGDIDGLTCLDSKGETVSLQSKKLDDTIFIQNEYASLVFSSPYGYSDTFDIKDLPTSDLRSENKFSSYSIKQYLNQRELSLEFLFPVSLMKDSLTIMLDSTEVPFELIDKGRTQVVRFAMDSSQVLRANISREGINSIFPLSEGVEMVTSMTSTENLSLLTIMATELDSTASYLLQVIDNQGDILSEKAFQNVKEYQWDMGYVSPEIMTLRLVNDKNNNGRWDNGSYTLKTYPEEKREVQIMELRPSWELEFKISP